VYNVLMAIKYGIRVLECDECGHRWLPEDNEALPGQCPSRMCRSRKWNASGKIVGEAAAQLPAQPSAPSNTIADITARLGLTTASKMHTPKPEPLPSLVEDDEPDLPMCIYTEYDSETGEWYRCGLRQHSGKVKHTRGNRV